MDYTSLIKEVNIPELVKALRERALRENEWYEHGGDIINDVAAAIEDLQAVLKEAGKKQAYQHDYICELVAEKEELQAETERLKAQLPKQGEWELIDEAEPMRWGCSRCKYLSWETSNYCPKCGAKMEMKK